MFSTSDFISTTTNRHAPACLPIILIFNCISIVFSLQIFQEVHGSLVYGSFQPCIFFFQTFNLLFLFCNRLLHPLDLLIHGVVDDAPSGIHHSDLTLHCPVQFSPDGMVLIEESSGQSCLLHEFRDRHFFFLIHHVPDGLLGHLHLFFASFCVQGHHFIVLAHIPLPILPNVLR